MWGIRWFPINSRADILEKKEDYRHTSFYCTSLYCALQILRFYKLKVCDNPGSSKYIGAIFPTAFAHFISLCHILVILTVFQTFPLLLYLLWWPVICNFWCYYCNCFGVPQTTPIWDGKLNWLMLCVFWLFHQLVVPISLPVLTLPVPWDTTVLKLGQVITSQWPLSVQLKGRVARLSL